MKLNKFISKYYTNSKKDAEKFILNKQVKVNKVIITDIFFDLRNDDKVFLKNKLITIKSSGYILYNKPKNLDLNSIPKHFKLFLNDFYYNNNYSCLDINSDCSGLVLFYDDKKFNYELRKKYISVLYDVKFELTLEKNQKNLLSDFVNNIDEVSEINFLKDNCAAIKILIMSQQILFDELRNYNYNSVDRVLILNLDKFEVPRGKFKKLNSLEILNFKSLSTSPNKPSS